MTYPPQDPYQPQPQYPPAVPGYQQPPTGWAPPPPPAKKRTGPLVWILGAVGVVLVLCVGFSLIGALTGGSKDTPTAGGAGTTAAGKPAAKAPATKKAPAKSAGIGDKVRDGKFEFTVTKVDCSKTKVGDSILNATAQGRYCIISVTVANIGEEPRTFDGSDQKAYAGKAEYTNDSTAELYVNGDDQTFLQDINPGNSVKGKLVFDVPKSTKLTSIELHDGWISGGATVSLA